MIINLRMCANLLIKQYQRKPFHRAIVIRYYSVNTFDDIDIVSDRGFKFDEVPVSRIRNFSIIAHVDHGKSTLADRLLELTGAIDKNTGQAQVLDSLQVEKERGITVKAQSASLLYRYHDDQVYLLNLIDTPGHVDFSNEVTRSLSACEGVILLVDANQGVQAQTVANYHLATSKGLVVVPVLNKIDLKNADPDRVCIEMSHLFNIDPESVMRVSAKVGIGIPELVNAIIERIPQPKTDRTLPFRSLLFDSWFHRLRGACNLIYVKDGAVKVGDEIISHASQKSYTVKSLSILRPHEHQVDQLNAGQVGLLACNMKTSSEATMGDTLSMKGVEVDTLPGLQSNQAMVFAGIYPSDQSKHVQLRSALEKLILNDSAVTISPDSSPALGQGWTLGFLGLLHMDVFCQRLQQEHDIETTMTAPSVTYKMTLCNKKMIKENGGETMYVSNPVKFPDEFDIKETFEPIVEGTIITPREYAQSVIGMCHDRRGTLLTTTDIDDTRDILTFTLPLSEVIVDFHDKLKSLTSGYASFDYVDRGYRPSKVVKLTFQLNQKPVDEFSRIVHISRANTAGRETAVRLRELVPRQQFLVAVQAMIGSKCIARENIKAYRKDVTQKLKYGGDMGRRKKLLQNQSEAKKKMRTIGNITIPQETYVKLLKR